MTGQVSAEIHDRRCACQKCMFGPFRFVGWHAQLEFKPQYLWIGAGWKRTGNCVDLWLCLLPCVPLHVSWWWSREPTEGGKA